MEKALAAPPGRGRRYGIMATLTCANWLVREGRISGVIDWACMGVGDPACDVMVAWKLHSGEARDAFRRALPTDDAECGNEPGAGRCRRWSPSSRYYTPENNAVLYREAEDWLALVLSEGNPPRGQQSRLTACSPAKRGVAQ